MNKLTSILIIVVVAVLGVVAFMGLPSQPAPIQNVAISSSEYNFTTPVSITGGLVKITFTNIGKEDHHAQMFRLNDGVTLQKFQSTVDAILKAAPVEGETAYLKFLDVSTFAGGPPPTPVSKTTEVIQDLKPGQYVLICFLAGPDGIPHVAKGMVKPLTVTTATGQPAPPQSQTTVELKDFAFVSSSDIGAGKTTVQVINTGKEAHEMVVVHLKGITAAQLQEMFLAPPPVPGEAEAPPPGPPPFEFAGGMQAIGPGERAWTSLDLQSGDYVYVCFIPSAANQGKPHAALGMFYPFKVP
ncbi:MAG: hypothetical protein FJ358_01755 [Thaumarchaeota archaeon]|nr:hypothetical protein [Nitrososphaerota archaeon]